MNILLKRNFGIVWSLCLLGLASNFAMADEGLIARWKLGTDAKNSVDGGPSGTAHAVDFRTNESFPHTVFNGRDSHIDIPANDSLRLGMNNFTISLFAKIDDQLDDDPGDLVSQFDAKNRTGFHLNLRNNAGVTHSQANSRQLQFGIDAVTEPRFTDEGRPGSAVYGQSMAVHADRLYVGTCEAGSNQAGHVHCYQGPGSWLDLGSPDKANSITGMAVYNGSLYVGSGKYRLGGSALQESENPNLGGRIFRHEGDSKWTEVGHFPGMEAVGGMVVFRGKLYVSSLYKPATFYRYEDDGKWTPLDVPNGKRVEALGVYDGFLWASGYDEGNVYLFDGQSWKDLGRVGEAENTQTYAFANYRGKPQVATWRTGKVFGWDNKQWVDRGRLGDELEVMGMLVHNGAFYAGTLPLAQIYRYEGEQKWSLLKQLDTTPDVKYRRVWTMAQYRGKLFATTLPSGHVWSMRTGQCITWDREFPSGWHHVAAQREGNVLRLFVDGAKVAESAAENSSSLNISNDSAWQIGAGSGDMFNGSLADVRLYKRALSVDEIREISKKN